MNTATSLRVTTPTDTDIAVSRKFDAPRHLVFDALTNPELLPRWHGRHGWNLVRCDVDLRVGGRWHFVARGPGGAEMDMRGEYREISPPDRLVFTERFEDDESREGLVTISLVEHSGRTTLTTVARYPSQAIRDDMVKSNMAQGAAESYDRLGDVLALSAVVERYRRRADIFEGKVAAVQPSQWTNPSPCDEWAARDVVGHIVEMHGVMLRPLSRGLSPAPAVASDPLGAFRSARADIEAVLDDPALAGVSVDTPVGRITLAEHIDRVVSADMVLHGWDLARATGQDDMIDPDEIALARAALQALPENILRMPGVLGPALEPPGDADEQTRLLAFVGRRAW